MAEKAILWDDVANMIEEYFDIDERFEGFNKDVLRLTLNDFIDESKDNNVVYTNEDLESGIIIDDFADYLSEHQDYEDDDDYDDYDEYDEDASIDDIDDKDDDYYSDDDFDDDNKL